MKMKKIFLGIKPSGDFLEDFGFCQLLNETICDISESATKRGDDVYIVVYNSLAYLRSSVVAVPVALSGMYEVSRVESNGTKAVTLSRSNESSNKLLVYFDTGILPPTGAAIFKLSLNEEIVDSRYSLRSPKETSMSNGVLKVEHTDHSPISFRVLNLLDNSEIDFVQRWGYYTSFDSKHQKVKGQNSGAYIFRPSNPNEELHIIRATNVSKTKISDLVEEMSVKYEVPWIEQYIRLYKGKSYIEIEYKVGPIPIDDGIGKEVVTRYITDISNNGVFFTDSNGREFQKRVRSYRSTWNLNETEPISGNYYPINAAIFIEDKEKSLGIVTDRSQGGSSLTDGSIEVMVQRRTLADDARGVGEPLNETDGCVSPYPPYGDATRHGEGIVIRGKHRLVIGKGDSGASITRKEMDEAFSEPLMFFGSTTKGREVPFRGNSFSLIQSALPKNVMLLTFQFLSHEPTKTFLIRIGHQFAKDEDIEMSRPVSVDMNALFDYRYKIVDCKEKTLSGNRNLEDWHRDRLRWTTDTSLKKSHDAGPTEGNIITLNPMEIRTFHVQIDSSMIYPATKVK